MFDFSSENGSTNSVVLRSQTAIFSFILIGLGKIGSRILTVTFLSQLFPVPRWATIGVNFFYREVSAVNIYE